MTFDIVIPVRNGAAYLRRTLPGAIATGCRCIVVDDASIDDSAAVAANLGASVLRLPEHAGPAAARNAGAAMSGADVLVFLDADVSVHDDTLPRIRDRFATRRSPDAVFGRYDDEPADSGVVSSYRNLLHAYTHATASNDAATFWTGCGAILRSRFIEIGGFNEHRTMDDVDLGYRLKDAGGTIALDPAIQVKHWKRWTFWRMIAVDVAYRGVPWAELVLERGRIENDLNVRWSQRASVALVCLAACAIPGWPLLAAAFCGAAAALNLGFYTFLRDRRGIGFATAAVPLHLLYHLYSGLSFGVALLRRGAGIRPAPLPQRELATRKTENHSSP